VATKSGARSRLAAPQVMSFVIGCLGLFWGITNFARGAVQDEFQSLEARLLHFETFSPAAATKLLEGAAAANDACDHHAQRALLLLEIPLVDAALRSGAVGDFDRHNQSLEARAKQTIACAPRDSFLWLLLFGLEVEHGRLDSHAFDLLATSYETSPNEAWVAVRRTAVAIPVVLASPEPVQEKILTEFQNLVRNRFLEFPARAYSSVSPATRALLQSRIEQLDPISQRAFSDAVKRARN
jgi:hypothetical protein